MSKKIVVITGSPRKDGNSFAMTDAFIETVKANGHTVVRFDAAEKHVQGCKACDRCFENDKPCYFDDDFNALAPEIESADAIVYTMPLYWFSFPAQLKAVIDRFYCLCGEDNELSGKECGLLACCEDTNPSIMDGLVTSYEQIADYLEWKSLGTVLVLGVMDPGDIQKTNGIADTIEFAKKF